MTNSTKWFDDNGTFVGYIPDQCATDCSVPGQDASEAVAFWMRKLSFEAPRDMAIKWLRETGAWSRQELEDMSDHEISGKVLWLACCDIRETGEWLGLIH